MDEQFKKRLVGSLIVISLAIIFFPLVFDGNEKDRTRFNDEMPDPPEIRLGLQSMENVKKKSLRWKDPAREGSPKRWLMKTIIQKRPISA